MPGWKAGKHTPHSPSGLVGSLPGNGPTPGRFAPITRLATRVHSPSDGCCHPGGSVERTGTRVRCHGHEICLRHVSQRQTTSNPVRA